MFDVVKPASFIDGLTLLLGAAEAYDQDVVDRWKDELDNLLVFVCLGDHPRKLSSNLELIQAGLFSAVVTAFTIESYSWLQQDPMDTSNKLLAQISTQLSSFQLSQGFINSTSVVMPADILSAAFTPDKDDVTINMLWLDRKSTRLNSSHSGESRMPSSA